MIWFGYGILNGNWFLEDVIYKNIKSSLIELDQDISFTPHAYISYCVCAVTILFIINDFVLLMGLKKNHPIIMLIWLLIGGINRAVSKLFDYFDVFNMPYFLGRGFSSNPKMEYQVFLCIFQKNSAMAT